MTDAHPLGLLIDAVDFAARKHSNQRRKDPDKTPYINHPIGVAHLLWKVGGVTDLPTLQVEGSSISRRACGLWSARYPDIVPNKLVLYIDKPTKG